MCWGKRNQNTLNYRINFFHIDKQRSMGTNATALGGQRSQAWITSSSYMGHLQPQGLIRTGMGEGGQTKESKKEKSKERYRKKEKWGWGGGTRVCWALSGHQSDGRHLPALRAFCFFQAAAAGLLLLLRLLLPFDPARIACLPGLLTRAAAVTALCSCAGEKVWLTDRPPTDWPERDSWPGLCTGSKRDMSNGGESKLKPWMTETETERWVSKGHHLSFGTERLSELAENFRQDNKSSI